MINRDLKAVDYLKSEDLEKIHQATLTVLEKNGIEFYSQEARDILKKNGAKVEGERVFFPPELVMEKIALAPSEFTLHARNPEKNVVVGGNNTVHAPGYGSPYVMDYVQNARRNANYDDYIAFTKLAGRSENLDVVGGVLVEPNDIPDHLRHAKMFHAAVKYTDKCLMGSAMGSKKAQETIEMASIIYGGIDTVRTNPCLISLINTNSPLEFDSRMLDALMVYARNNQPVIIAALAMTGTTSPVTLAGSLVQQAAEILSGIIFAQMVSPGTPVVFGSASSIVDLRTGNLAIGSPESVKMFSVIAQLARFYGLPSRGGGALTDAIITDSQSGYESMMVLMNTILSGTNFILHSAGLLENYMTMSYEKFVIDDEMLGMVKSYAEGFPINEDTLAVDTLLRVGSGGNFIADEHTFNHMRDMRLPFISARINYAGATDLTDTPQRAHEYVKSVLQDFQNPPLDEKVEAELDSYIEKLSK
ncbi:MAG: trimethylamine methyltransferase family protein [Bacillota bacterium]|nr:trimethylamine methyltransferase family protein [Bacillota bacterium]